MHGDGTERRPVSYRWCWMRLHATALDDAGTYDSSGDSVEGEEGEDEEEGAILLVRSRQALAQTPVLFETLATVLPCACAVPLRWRIV